MKDMARTWVDALEQEVSTQHRTSKTVPEQLFTTNFSQRNATHPLDGRNTLGRPSTAVPGTEQGVQPVSESLDVLCAVVGRGETGCQQVV